jgi:hypothetical protein
MRTTDVITAYRAWRIYPARRELEPLAFFQVAPWNKMSKAVASCEHFRRHPHELAPAQSCQCGFYGFKRLSGVCKLLQYYVDAELPIVVGRVAFWGMVRDHTDGYRAQYAYPQILYYGGSSAAKALVQAVGNEYACESMPAPPELAHVRGQQYISNLGVQEWHR